MKNDETTKPINRLAIFADGTPRYRNYTAKGNGNYDVRLRLRTGKGDVEAVKVISNTMEKQMHVACSDRLFDYFEAELTYPDCGTRYCFELKRGEEIVILNKRGPMDEIQEYYNFCFRPDFSTPEWAKGAVFYQIFTDRFHNGDPTNDVRDSEYSYIHMHSEAEKDWDAMPKNLDVARFYGGDLQGIWDKLDYLQELGVEVLYLNPIFVSPSSHKYDTQDYDYIDPHFGKIVVDMQWPLAEGDEDNRHAMSYITRTTDLRNLEASNAFFAEFVEELHRRGMKIVLDGVFNHCGSFNKWLDREHLYEGQAGYAPGAYTEASSPYKSYFGFKTQQWPYNQDYEGWWGYNTLPKLNYEGSEELYQNILDIAGKWLKPPYNIDGWRLDVAADLGHTPETNHQFWKDFRKTVKSINPDALILAEHYEDPKAWLEGDEWDTVMNYSAFMDPLSYFLTGVEKHSEVYRDDLVNDVRSFKDAMSHHMSRFHYESVLVAMNELSNHDHSRFLTRTNGKVGRLHTDGPEAAGEGIRPEIMREAVIIQMTWPGAPTVYYGDEAGVCGWTDPDNRRTYPWGHEDQEMLKFHKDIIALHRSSTALRKGSFKMLTTEDGILAFGRFDEHEQFVTIINNLDKPVNVKVPVWTIGICDEDKVVTVFSSDKRGYSSRKGLSHCVHEGMISVRMMPKSGVILKRIG